MSEIIANNEVDFNTDIVNFIGQVVEKLRVDKDLFKMNAVSGETKSFYENFLPGNEMNMIHTMRAQTSLHLIGKSIAEYAKEIHKRKAKPQRIAFNAYDSKLLVWAQIQDDDELTENALIMAEAQVNSEFSKLGFYISSTIVEECDNISTPPHYQELKIPQ